MAKRKLTRRQSWRAEKIQAERLARSQKKVAAVESTLEGSSLGPEQAGRVITRFGAQVELEDAQQNRHRCLMRRNLPSMVCGDRVVWQAGPDNTGIVVAMEERDSLLERPDADNQLKPVAANIDQILVVAAPEPVLDIDLINRYFIAAEMTGIPPVLIINKIDLLSDSALAQLRTRFKAYEDIGYSVIYATTKHPQGLDDLLHHLMDKTSIFVGQSGVGKSSLIQVLLPEEELRVNTLSELSREGRHTTTTTRLYHFPAGGELVDSPGIRAFRLGHANNRQITHGFREFHPYIGRCRFSNCRHTVEPDCALLDAVASKSVSADRFESYQRIITATEELTVDTRNKHK
jgi:ribosome biogenesis GTPase / thiamine phosphate phosphatase